MSHEVLAHMKTMMQESASASASHSFLLDDDSTIPFTQEDVASQLDDKVGAGAGGRQGLLLLWEGGEARGGGAGRRGFPADRVAPPPYPRRTC